MEPTEFRPRKYDVTREELKSWRDAGESTVTIAGRFPGCHPETVRDWLIAWDLPTTLKVKPSDEPPGKAPVTKRVVFEAERAARYTHHTHNTQSDDEAICAGVA